jgi:hypothetical protein
MAPAQQGGWWWDGSNWVCDPDCGPPACPPFGPPVFSGPVNQPPWYPGANGGVSFGTVGPANPVRGHFWFDGTTMWLFDGAGWVSVGGTSPIQVDIKAFGGSINYQPPPGLVSLIVECIGGGGGGGAVVASIPATFVVGAAGGGSGGYSRKALSAAMVAGGAFITIGQGGAANANGTATSFGSFCIANGGGGAGVQAGFWGIAGGVGASIGIGDFAMQGMTGDNGTAFPASGTDTIGAAGGIGGAIWGGSRTLEVGPNTASAGDQAFANSGAGGSGACVNQLVAAAQAGGAGGSGICIVTEYTSSQA